jgi:hypothetical protein
VVNWIGSAAICTAISDDAVLLRASYPPQFPRGSKLGVFTKGNKGNKESQLLPWLFVPFVAF